MDISIACQKAEEIASLYNKDGIAPFPFQRILDSDKNISISYSEGIPDRVSGVIFYDSDLHFVIMINKNKPINRQYFTIAHELGHYYLHADYLKEKEIIIDEGEIGTDPALYRVDNLRSPSKLEKEANNFAASLLMPSKLVTEAWKSLKDVEECAKIFEVSFLAMSIRLARLKLVD